jgi:PAS domain S-box-containing protein
MTVKTTMSNTRYAAGITELSQANGGSSQTATAEAPLVRQERAGPEELLRELEALRRSEANLRDFVETASIGLHWVSGDGAILWANQAELDLLGYSRDEYLGRHIAEFHADKPVIEDILACLNRGEILREFPARLRCKDGSIRHVLINSSVLFEDGKFVHTRCFTRDITDRKQAEEALRESKNHLHEIIEAIPAAIYTTDTEGRIKMFNRASVEFSGRTPELNSDHWCVTWKLYWPDGTPLPHDQCPMAMALKEGRPVRGYEAIAERPDGTRRNFMPFPMPLYDTSGKLTGAVNMLVDITDRKQAEEALRESEERLRAIFNSSAVGVAVLTPDARFLQVNAAFCAITGYSEAELKEIDCVALTHPDDCARMRSQITQLISGQIPTFVIEKRYFRKDGAMIWVQNSVSLTRDAAGQPANIIALCQNITERKRTEDALRISEYQYRTLFNSMDEGFCTVEVIFDADDKPVDYRFLEVNRAFERQTGIKDGKGRSMREIAPHHEEHWFQIYGRIALTGQPERFENEAKELGRWHDVYAFRIDDPGLRRVAIIFNDVTERRRREAQFREASERLRFMAESMPQKIFTARPSGDVDYFNQQWMEFTGLTFDQIKNWGWKQFIHPEDIEENIRLWKQSLDTGEPFEFVHRFRRKDGVYRWHLSRAQAMRDAAGNISMWIGSNTDIHEEKQTEEELRRANEDLNLFAFAASHDLQEPLRMITSYSQLLVKEHRGAFDDDAEVLVGYIGDGTRRMRELLSDLLAYTAVGEEQEEASHLIDVNSVVRKVLENLKTSIREAGASISVDPLPCVRGAEVHFVQLFQNLIGNAIKYRGQRPATIHVSAQQINGEWRFEVSDKGIGIAPEYHEKVFAVFKRLHGKKIPGTGVGLAICKRVVERHGGRIWVESQAGQGAKFRFTLPVAGEDR